LSEKIKKSRQALHQIGRFTSASDPAYAEMNRLIQGEMEHKLEYIREHSSIELGDGADVSHINRLLMFIFNCCKKKTLPAFVQKELQQCAMDAETVTKDTLCDYFRRLFREEVFSPKKSAQAQDESMCSQLSGGSIGTLRSLENLSPREKGVFPSRSSLQRHNYSIEVGAETKFIEAEETEEGSIFRISPTCIINEMLSASKDLVDHFGRTAEEMMDPLRKPPVIRLAATIDGGALTCHKGFIIYGIKFVQREFVNLILGKDISDGSDDDIEENQQNEEQENQEDGGEYDNSDED